MGNPISTFRHTVRQLWRQVLLVAVLAALALSGARGAQGQTSDLAAPRVISSTPAQREVVSPAINLQIIFDQPMDRTSVESAFQIDPKGDGKLSWTDDSTLIFTPAAPFQRGQEVHVSIGTGAKSTAGAALAEAYQLTFEVQSNLAVTQVLPAPDTQSVAAQATITVVFNRPVVPLINSADQAKLPQPLTLSPAVDGTGEWVGTAIYVFHPTKGLAGGTQYTATINGDLQDVDGNPIGKPYSWKFGTIAPQILGIDPPSDSGLITLDTQISVTFNQPMDPDSTKAAFSVRNASKGTTVAGTVTFANDGAQLLFKPQSILELDTAYQISVLGTAHSASGTSNVTNPTTFVVHTFPYPAVVSSNPPNGGKIPPGAGLLVTFNAAMDQNSFAGKVHVDPKPDNLNIFSGGETLDISFASLPATTYTVTIDAGISDPYGNAIKTPTVITFTTLNASPSLGLATKDTFAFTSAYRADTVVNAAAINISQIDSQISALEPVELFGLLDPQNGYPQLNNYKPPRVTRAWSTKVDAKVNERAAVALKLAGDQGGKLAPGVYYLQVTSPEFQKASILPIQRIVIVATASMTIKIGPDEALVWVTDLKTGQPLPNVTVDLYSRTLQHVATGKTDANGLFRTDAIKGQVDNQPYLAVASADGVYSLGSTAWAENFQPANGSIQQDPQPRRDVVYLYTDQPIYRPGHPVLFRGVVRNQDDVTFGVPANQPVQVSINDAQGKQVFTAPMTLNTYGAFSGKFDLPSDAPLGNYSLLAHYNDQDFSLNFQLAEFRPPEFVVKTTPAASEVVAGDTIKVGVDSSFYSGGVVSGAKVTWVAIANQGFFNYTGDGNYDFENGSYGFFGGLDDSNRLYVYNKQVGSGQGQLDDKGHFDISLPADLGGATNTQDFTIEATVTDISNQAISGRSTVTVHPAQLVVGLQPAAYVGKATQPMDVNVIAVDWASKPLPGQSIALKVNEQRYEQDLATLQWTAKLIPVADGKITTDDKGKAVFTFTPPRAGIYLVEADARDDGERIATTTTTVWVSGPEFVPWNTQNNNLLLVADKKQYAAGDTASILIPSPFPEPVKALVTIERAGIIKTDVIEITGSFSYKLPIDTLYAPNVYVAVALVRGSSGGGDKDVVPEVRYGLLNLPVSVPQQLKIIITPSTTSAKPGDTVKFDVQITDLQGNPVAAEVGVSLSDLANLSVGQANSQKIFDFFWHPRGLSITTTSPLSRLIDDLTAKDAFLQQVDPLRRDQSFSIAGGGGDAGVANAQSSNEAAADGIVAAKSAAAPAALDKAQQAPTPRTDFVDTPLWVPSLITDASGHATTQVTLPDNLTTWRLDARAISQKTYVGDASLDVISTKPLLVRPSTPRFFVVGDETQLAVVVNNNSGNDLTVDVALDAKGVTLKGAAKQAVSVPKAGRVQVTWLATVDDVPNVDLSFSAVSGEFSDASKPEVGIGDQRLLPVYNYEAPDYVSTAGTLTQPGTRTEAVIVPNATLAPTGELTIKLQPSLAAATLDGLDYLQNYPYQCVEQTVSKFLPNVITYRALQKLALDKPELRTSLDANVRYALARLQREQHPDGGWGWFPEDESNPLTTTYALLGLVEAKASDVQVSDDMYQRALAFVSSTVQPINDNTEQWQLNRQAFVLYVLARAGSPNPSAMDQLFARREKTNLFARAFLAQSYGVIQGDSGKINTLLSDLQSAAIVSATGTHWEEGYRDWWNWDSDTRTTAIVLKTLVDLAPKSELIPNVVRWLMVARKADAWETTQETAWAIMGLTDWMDVSGELKADYGFNVSVNGKSIGDGKASADTLRDTTTLQISVADMLREQANKVTFDHSEGPGNLYYTATLHVNQPVDLIKATNRGIGLSRTYLIDNKPVTSAKVGDVITVALEITANSDLYYANINDPIPAGTELVDTSLQTTSQIGQTPELTEIDPYNRGWGWWWFSNTELRTDKIVLSASYLPKGTYRFIYQIRASSVGAYKVIPANGQEFYFPEVFGRGDGSLFTVTQ